MSKAVFSEIRDVSSCQLSYFIDFCIISTKICKKIFVILQGMFLLICRNFVFIYILIGYVKLRIKISCVSRNGNTGF